MTAERSPVAVVGLGYVGLPLAVAFSSKRLVTGFDINSQRVAELRVGHDRTHEISREELVGAANLVFTSEINDLRDARIYIITVPTPIDPANRPDLRAIIDASRAIGGVLKAGDVVVYESTVYPGATEEVCIPELEQASGLKWKRDFYVGYSPERINPGDKEHTLARVVKVVSADTPVALQTLASLYAEIIPAGIHLAPSIKIAEAAKVIENTQRDLNIALMNEIATIFDRIGVDTSSVLEAAATKWNFLKFRPGLVGGHCIGVDPYYLTYKAETVGYHPQVILSGRRINDGMGKFIAEKVVKLLIARGVSLPGAKVLVMGLTFKEDCPDLRNSKVVDLIADLKSYGCDVVVTDPLADPAEARREYGLNLLSESSLATSVDAIVLAVAHREYRLRAWEAYESRLSSAGVFADVKGCVVAPASHPAYWRL